MTYHPIKVVPSLIVRPGAQAMFKITASCEKIAALQNECIKNKKPKSFIYGLPQTKHKGRAAFIKHKNLV